MLDASGLLVVFFVFHHSLFSFTFFFFFYKICQSCAGVAKDTESFLLDILFSI